MTSLTKYGLFTAEIIGAPKPSDRRTPTNHCWNWDKDYEELDNAGGELSRKKYCRWPGNEVWDLGKDGNENEMEGDSEESESEVRGANGILPEVFTDPEGVFEVEHSLESGEVWKWEIENADSSLEDLFRENKRTGDRCDGKCAMCGEQRLDWYSGVRSDENMFEPAATGSADEEMKRQKRRNEKMDRDIWSQFGGVKQDLWWCRCGWRAAVDHTPFFRHRGDCSVAEHPLKMKGSVSVVTEL